MSLPSQEYLKSRIDYNPETGEAKWKPVDESYGAYWKRFNTLHSGQPLGIKVRLDTVSYTAAKLIYKLVHNRDVGRLIYLNGDTSDLRIKNLTDVMAQVDIVEEVNNYKQSHEDLNNLLTLEHETGTLRWKPRDEPKSFNAQYAGNVAGYEHKKTGYVDVGISNQHFRAHRLIWCLYYGVDPVDYKIDHIDGNKLNNSVKNLRLANNSLNIHNAKSKTAKGYKITPEGRYRASIRIRNKHVSLGTYDTPEEATAAYNAALVRYRSTYVFTTQEQAQLDELYSTYPNCSKTLQLACHNLQVKAIKYYDDEAIVQTQNLEFL